MTKRRWQEIRKEIEKADLLINTEKGFETVKRFFVLFEALERLLVFENEPADKGKDSGKDS